jgi:hypothetical protein
MMNASYLPYLPTTYSLRDYLRSQTIKNAGEMSRILVKEARLLWFGGKE